MQVTQLPSVLKMIQDKKLALSVFGDRAPFHCGLIKHLDTSGDTIRIWLYGMNYAYPLPIAVSSVQNINVMVQEEDIVINLIPLGITLAVSGTKAQISALFHLLNERND